MVLPTILSTVLASGMELGGILFSFVNGPFGYSFPHLLPQFNLKQQERYTYVESPDDEFESSVAG